MAFTVSQVLERIRFDRKTKRGSVLDVVQLVTKCSQVSASRVFQRLCRSHPELTTCTEGFKFPSGRGQRPTPIASLPDLVKIIMLLPGKGASNWRRNGAEVLCRALGGDESLIPEIEAQKSATEGTIVAEMAHGQWTPLSDMDFSIDDADDDPSGLVYLAGSPDFSFVKVGSWSGTVPDLFSRYKMYYGARTWLKAWESDDRRAHESAVLFALKGFSVGGELHRCECLEHATHIISLNLNQVT